MLQKVKGGVKREGVVSSLLTLLVPTTSCKCLQIPRTTVVPKPDIKTRECLHTTGSGIILRGAETSRTSQSCRMTMNRNI